jgi:hypothetical protein
MAWYSIHVMACSTTCYQLRTHQDDYCVCVNLYMQLADVHAVAKAIMQENKLLP